MSSKNKVIYWHRLGLKVYEVEKNNAVLMRDIETTEINEIEEHLGFLKDSSVYLLLSDAISYLFKSALNESELIDEGFRSRLLEIVKADIPEDFSDFSWDYKILESDGNKNVLIFAPVAEVQAKINVLSKNLGIKFVVIEPESISANRDPNPIVGITKKNDVAGKDEEVLNIVVDEKEGNNNNFFKIIIIILGVGIFLVGNYYLYNKFFTKKTEIKKEVVVEIVPSVIPTIVVERKIEELNIVVQNGTKTAGKAGKVVDKIKELGAVNVTGGNADNTDYVESKVYFKNEEIKKISIDKILSVVLVVGANILIDNTMENDVKLILGIN